MKILYVEDNDDLVYFVKRRFARVGFTVLVATDGEQGVAMAAADRPDLILMDLGLPRLDGWEATRRIKSQPETRHIPVIVMASDLDPAADWSLANPAGVLIKPFPLTAMLNEIRRVLRASAQTTGGASA